MKEFVEQKYYKEISEDDFQKDIQTRINEIWMHHEWNCQKIVKFTEKRIKAGGPALVVRTPDSFKDDNDSFEVLFYLGKDSQEREKIMASLDFVIPHEIGHGLSKQNREKYQTELPKEQFDDLNKSKKINPEHFYTGAHEITSDVFALKLLEKEGKEGTLPRALTALLELEREHITQYLDVARLEVFLDYLKSKELVYEEEVKKAELLFKTFREKRQKDLDSDDLRRFDELKDYLITIIRKVEQIKL